MHPRLPAIVLLLTCVRLVEMTWFHEFPLVGLVIALALATWLEHVLLLGALQARPR